MRFSGPQVTGKEIFRTYDEFGPIVVTDRGQLRLLSFGNNDEQSCQLLADPTLLVHEYNRTMLLVTLFEPVHHVTLLGLGGGMLAHCLWARLGITDIQVVELRYRVMKVARKYFSFPGGQQIPVTISDAQQYLQNALACQTDLILCDVFSADGFDVSLLNPGFISDCHAHLTERGWLVINSWLEQNQLRSQSQLLHEYFQDVRLAPTLEGNWVIFAGKQAGPAAGRSLDLAARAMSSRIGFSMLPALRKLTKA
jgi:spermidine synthase